MTQFTHQIIPQSNLCATNQIAHLTRVIYTITSCPTLLNDNTARNNIEHSKRRYQYRNHNQTNLQYFLHAQIIPHHTYAQKITKNKTLKSPFSGGLSRLVCYLSSRMLRLRLLFQRNDSIVTRIQSCHLGSINLIIVITIQGRN